MRLKLKRVFDGDCGTRERRELMLFDDREDALFARTPLERTTNRFDILSRTSAINRHLNRKCAVFRAFCRFLLARFKRFFDFCTRRRLARSFPRGDGLGTRPRRRLFRTAATAAS